MTEVLLSIGLGRLGVAEVEVEKRMEESTPMSSHLSVLSKRYLESHDILPLVFLDWALRPILTD